MFSGSTSGGAVVASWNRGGGLVEGVSVLLVGVAGVVAVLLRPPLVLRIKLGSLLASLVLLLLLFVVGAGGRCAYGCCGCGGGWGCCGRCCCGAGAAGL